MAGALIGHMGRGFLAFSNAERKLGIPRREGGGVKLWMEGNKGWTGRDKGTEREKAGTKGFDRAIRG